MRLLPLVLLVLIGAASAQPSAVQFERARDVEPSLPQSSVYDVLEDDRGFLWFATREGLGRWDGYSMRVWRRDPFDAASLPGNVVRQLVLDETGDLWVVTEATDWTPAGIARLLGPSHEEVRRYGHLGARLFIGPDGVAWLADSLALYRFDGERDRFVRLRPRLHHRLPTHGLASRDGTVWIASDAGLEAYPPTGPARVVLPDRPWANALDDRAADFRTMAEGDDGTLWVGGLLLGRLDASRTVIETLDLPTPSIQGYGTGLGVNTILPDADGLWLATLNGVHRYRFADGTSERYSLQLPGDIATQNWVAGLYRDRAGTLWAGTVWGLHRATPSGPPFRLLAHDPDDPNTLGSGIVLSIHRDRRGSLWVGTLGGGLNRIDADGTVRRYRHDPNDDRTLSHDWVWSLRSDPERLWIGTGDGLNAIDLDTPGVVERVPSGTDPTNTYGPSANGLWMDEAETLWFGHIGGLHRRRADGQHPVVSVPTGAGIQTIRTAPGGAWIASDAGLLWYDETEDAFRAFRHDAGDPTTLSDNATITLHRDRRGRLWVGTQSGLDRFDDEAGTFTHFSSADGLPSNVIYAILEDDRGRLWISTNRGLARYDEAATPRVRPYTVADGVGNVEFNRNAAFRDADGTMYFGGDRGVTVFHPDALAAPARQSPIVLTALHRSTRDGTETEPYVGSSPVVLAPGVTTVGFEFAALNFLHPHRSRYAAQMEGWDDDWVELGTQRQATYTNLPPGQYTFRVRASNEDGVWTDGGVAVPLIVRPRVHQTAWFQSLVALALLGLFAGVGWDVSRRRYRRALARVEAQRALEAERARISRDMHDEVGASLSEIAILSEVTRRQLDAREATEDRLRRIADTSRAMLDTLGQIVWAITPRNDRLTALAGYLREHASRYLDTAGIRPRLHFPAHLPDRPVSAEVRRAVFLVLKEALHNVVTHADAQEVRVAFTVETNRLRLVVADDGRGFAPPSGDGAPARYVGGNGLGNMKRRAEEVDGVLAIDARLGHGTSVQLTIALDPASPLPGRRRSRSPVDVTRHVEHVV